MQTLSQDRLREILHYDAETGVFTWKVRRSQRSPAGSVAGTKCRGYVVVRIDYEGWRAHRLAHLYMTGTLPPIIDHINGDKADNRWANLRVVTHAVNLQNERKPRRSNKTGFLGVMQQNGKFIATIQVDRACKRIGAFDTPEEAHAAYVAVKRTVHPGCTL